LFLVLFGVGMLYKTPLRGGSTGLMKVEDGDVAHHFVDVVRGDPRHDGCMSLVKDLPPQTACPPDAFYLLGCPDRNCT